MSHGNCILKDAQSHTKEGQNKSNRNTSREENCWHCLWTFLERKYYHGFRWIYIFFKTTFHRCLQIPNQDALGISHFRPILSNFITYLNLKTHKWTHQFSHFQCWTSKLLTFLCRVEHTHSGWIVNHILSNEWTNIIKHEPRVTNQALSNGYRSIPIDTFLVGWTSIYQLFWGSPGG